jgi:hypothetical protein
MTGPKQYIPGNLVALDINKQALEPLVFKSSQMENRTTLSIRL